MSACCRAVTGSRSRVSDGDYELYRIRPNEGALAAVKAGVHSIEHGTYLSDDTLTLMRKEGTYYVPTITRRQAPTPEDRDNPMLAEHRREDVALRNRLVILAEASVPIGLLCGGDSRCPYRCRAWQRGLRRLSDALRLTIHVSHFPPGTSTWNKIEHRLFCHITKKWRDRPLRTFEIMVELIGHARTATELRVRRSRQAASI